MGKENFLCECLTLVLSIYIKQLIAKKDLVQTVCRESFGVVTNEEWALHKAPTPKEVTEYDLEGKGGPSADDLCINMRGKVSSKWNHAVGELLLDTIHKWKQGQAWNSLPERSDTYLLKIVTEQLEHARTVWRDAQPRVKVDGALEDLAEVEE